GFPLERSRERWRRLRYAVMERVHERDGPMQAAGGAVIREESEAVQVHDIGPAEVGPEDGRVVSQMDQRPISADRNSFYRTPRGKGLAANPARGGVDEDLMAGV